MLYTILTSIGMRPAELARAIGVDKATVRRWQVGRIPAERVLEIERATGISREKLRPDLFGGAS